MGIRSVQRPVVGNDRWLLVAGVVQDRDHCTTAAAAAAAAAAAPAPATATATTTTTT